MNTLDELLTVLSDAPSNSRMIDASVVSRLKDLIGKSSHDISIEMKSILDDCAHYGLVADFLMKTMDILYQESLKLSIVDGSCTQARLVLEHYPDNVLITAKLHDNGKYAPECYVNVDGKAGVSVEECEPVFDTEAEAITDMKRHLSELFTYFTKVIDEVDSEPIAE
jgi:hypothetical protein